MMHFGRNVLMSQEKMALTERAKSLGRHESVARCTRWMKGFLRLGGDVHWNRREGTNTTWKGSCKYSFTITELLFSHWSTSAHGNRQLRSQMDDGMLYESQKRCVCFLGLPWPSTTETCLIFLEDRSLKARCHTLSVAEKIPSFWWLAGNPWNSLVYRLITPILWKWMSYDIFPLYVFLLSIRKPIKWD